MNQDLSLGASVVATRNQVSSELDGEAVILNLDRGMYYGLDEVGSRVWRLIQQPCALHVVRDVLVGEYNVSMEHCERDLLQLVRQLAEAGLVTVNDAQIQ